MKLDVMPQRMHSLPSLAFDQQVGVSSRMVAEGTTQGTTRTTMTTTLTTIHEAVNARLTSAS